MNDMQEKNPCVYLLANKPGGVLYLGVTSDLVKRVWQHKNAFVDGFSKNIRSIISSGLNRMRIWIRPLPGRSA